MNVAEILLEITQLVKHKSAVLTLSHSDYRVSIGGTEKVIQEEQVNLLARGISYIQVFPKVPYHQLQSRPGYAPPSFGLTVDSVLVGYLTANQIFALIPLIQELGVSFTSVHIHHLLGIGTRFAEGLVSQLPDVPVRFFLHDYYAGCPQFNFLKNDSTYCSVPAVGDKICNGCAYGDDRPAHYEGFNRLLSTYCTEMIAPSEVAAKEWARAFPHLESRIRVVPHQISTSTTKIKKLRRDGKIRIAYVGYQSINKGWLEWVNFINRFEESDRFEFYHFGACQRYHAKVKHYPISFVDDKKAMIKALRNHDIDVAFLWSIWPETYSFTLYESLAAGCFVATCSMSGNIAEQVRGTKRGMVFKDRDELFDFFADQRKTERLTSSMPHYRLVSELEPNPFLADEIAEKSKAKGAFKKRTLREIEALVDAQAIAAYRLGQDAELLNYVQCLESSISEKERAIGEMRQAMEALKEHKANDKRLRDENSELRRQLAQQGQQIHQIHNDEVYRHVQNLKPIVNRVPAVKRSLKFILKRI